MPISYSGIINYGKATLPSVESWGSNNNILRDPPRSITTRRIDKVSETMMIDQEIQESGNRVAESIRVYPRGANVMVGVSFNNNNSAGNRGNVVGSQQAKLPYRIMRDGAFRPPILHPVNLLPLSRLPRNAVTVDPVAYTADFKRKLVCPGTAENYRSVKNVMLQVQTDTTKTKNIRKVVEIGVGQNIIQHKLHADTETKKTRNIQRPVEIAAGQSIVQNKLHADAETKKLRNIQRPVEMAAGQSIVQNKLHADAETKKLRNIQRPVEMAAGQSIVQNKLHADAQSNSTKNIYIRNVEPVIIYQTNARPQASTTSNVKGIGKQYILHEVQEIRSKPVLKGEIIANTNRRGMYAPDSQQPMSRDLLLAKRAHHGSKESTPSIPTFDRNMGEARLKGNGFFDMMRKTKQ
jgi:hypothetical protein